MDLLFARYASPFLLVDEYIRTCSFNKFIESFVNDENERELKMWYFNTEQYKMKSFNDYKNGIVSTSKQMNVSNHHLETTINNSKNLISNFKPS